MKRLIVIYFCFLNALHAQSPVDSLLNYHPLSIGNVWYYQQIWRSFSGDHYAYEIHKIVGDTSINSHVYKIIIVSSMPHLESSTYFLRYDSSSRTIIKMNTGGIESLIDSLAEDSAYTTPAFSVKSDPFYSLFDTTVPSRIVEQYKDSIINRIYRFACNIGLVSYKYAEQSDDVAFRLIRAIIDGKEYRTSDPNAVHNYFPVDESALWIFRDYGSGGYITRRILGDSLLPENGKKYTVFGVEVGGSSQFKKIRKELWRTDTSDGVLYTTSLGDFPEVMIDSLLCPPHYSFGQRFKVWSIETTAVQNHKTVVRKIGERQVLPGVRFISFAKHIGIINHYTLEDHPIYSTLERVGNYLIYAKIDSLEVGVYPALIEHNTDSLLQFLGIARPSRWIYRRTLTFPGGNRQKMYIERRSDGISYANDTLCILITERNLTTNETTFLMYYMDEATGKIYERGTPPKFIDSLACTEGTFPRYSIKSSSSDMLFGTAIPSRTISQSVNTDYFITDKFSYGFGLSYGLKEHAFGMTETDELIYAMIGYTQYGTTAELIADSLALYHPLHKGNTWVYQRTTYANPAEPKVSLYEKEIVGDTLINLISYMIVRQRSLPSGPSVYEYERFDSTTGNYICYHPAYETVEDSTATNVPGTKFAFFGAKELRKVYADTLFGNTTMFRDIGLGNSVSENDKGWTYAHGIGLVSEYISDLANFIYTYKDILLYAKINGTEYGTNPLSVDDDNKPSLPTEFSLLQNYPNPFNPSTTIRYDLPASGNVMLKVFDMLGREVSTIVNERQTPGRYSVQFDASTLASGLYFYQLHINGFTSVKKMMVVK